MNTSQQVLWNPWFIGKGFYFPATATNSPGVSVLCQLLDSSCLSTLQWTVYLASSCCTTSQPLERAASASTRCLLLVLSTLDFTLAPPTEIMTNVHSAQQSLQNWCDIYYLYYKNILGHQKYLWKHAVTSHCYSVLRQTMHRHGRSTTAASLCVSQL